MTVAVVAAAGIASAELAGVAVGGGVDGGGERWEMAGAVSGWIVAVAGDVDAAVVVMIVVVAVTEGVRVEVGLADGFGAHC